MDVAGKIAHRKAFNLSTQQEVLFIGIAPSEAVIAAHAQSIGDFNTWDYTQDKYPVEFGENGCACGDWYCLY